MELGHLEGVFDKPDPYGTTTKKPSFPKLVGDFKLSSLPESLKVTALAAEHGIVGRCLPYLLGLFQAYFSGVRC